MIRHLFRITWNRRRANGLILVEILISFLVLTGVLTVGMYMLDRWQKPLGFEWENVWMVDMSYGSYYQMEPEARQGVLDRLGHLLREVESFPAVDHVGLASNVPYSGDTNATTTFVGGMETNVLTCSVTPSIKDVYDLELVAGRWFDASDRALEWTPVVITTLLARDWFGDEDPVGKFVPAYTEEGMAEPNEPGDDRIIGVVSRYRRGGELSQERYAMFDPSFLDSPDHYPPMRLMVRLAPGTPAAFEEDLANRLHALAPDWRFNVRPQYRMRSDRLRQQIIPPVLGGVVAAFLIGMVGLGLVGVLWQSVSRRTSEIGVRRAMGATAQVVRRQILGELLAVTTLAVAAGCLIVIQFPILDIVSVVSWRIYLLGLGASLAVVYFFVFLCGLYPSWLATRVHPARALQYE